MADGHCVDPRLMTIRSWRYRSHGIRLDWTSPRPTLHAKRSSVDQKDIIIIRTFKDTGRLMHVFLKSLPSECMYTNVGGVNVLMLDAQWLKHLCVDVLHLRLEYG